MSNVGQTIMSDCKMMIQAISDTIADYRQGEITPRTPELIQEWLQQFTATIHDPLIQALADVFAKTYVSRNAFKSFLTALAKTKKISSDMEPRDYWQQANLLCIQQGGNSQSEILKIFNEVLQETHGYSLLDTGSDKGDYVYLDDCIGTGNRVRWDVCGWLETDTPSQITLHIITPILYQGSWWIDAKINEAAEATNKKISLHRWRLDEFDMENRLARRNISDVLWPTEIPDNSAVKAYTEHLEKIGHPVVLRESGYNKSKIFKDDAQKILLEQAFLIRGCEIRQECSNLPDNARPLGYHNLDCLGFGSMFVTYRNCPNNCPLALWVQQAEYPSLFPRKTNRDTEAEKLIENFRITNKKKQK